MFIPLSPFSWPYLSMRRTSPTEAIQNIIREQKMSEWIDKQSPLYKATLSEFPIQFALGKHQIDPVDGTLFFLPIYAFSRGKLRYAIGYYRIKQLEFPDAVLEDGGLHIEKLGEPVFFKKIGKKALPFGMKFIADHLDMAKQGKKSMPNPTPTLKSDIFEEDKPKQEEKEEDDEEDDPSSLFHIKKTHKEPLTEEALFDKKVKKLLPALAEETEDSMEKQQAAFRKDPPKNASWVARFMLDDRYTLEDPPTASQDPLLECLMEALEDQGWTTTLDKLRQAMAQKATPGLFQEEKTLYMALRSTENQFREDKVILDQRQQTIHKHLSNPTVSELDRETLTEEKERIDKAKTNQTDQEKRIQEAIEEWVPTFSEDATLDSYRDSIRQAHPHRAKHPLNIPLLGLLERVLQMKIILFLEPALPDSPDFVINLVPPMTKEPFQPRFFALLALSSTKNKNNVQLVRFSSRAILTFQELPYAVRARLQTRALEDPQHHALLGLPEFPEEPPADNPVHVVVGPLPDPEIRLVIGSHAPPQHPLLEQYLDIERIPIARKAEFLPLKHLPVMWRRNLSDEDMIAKFQLDGHTWHSVFHYLHAQPYKDKASIYAKWTAGQEFSKEPGPKTIRRAKKAIKELGQPPLQGQEKEEARTKAWQAKKQQNEDISQILRATQNAMLLLFKRGHPLEPDTFLMSLRSLPN